MISIAAVVASALMDGAKGVSKKTRTKNAEKIRPEIDLALPFTDLDDGLDKNMATPDCLLELQ